jgi:hypothetical protein
MKKELWQENIILKKNLASKSSFFSFSKENMSFAPLALLLQ